MAILKPEFIAAEFLLAIVVVGAASYMQAKQLLLRMEIYREKHKHKHNPLM